jgi:hypothetical protein
MLIFGARTVTLACRFLFASLLDIRIISKRDYFCQIGIMCFYRCDNNFANLYSTGGWFEY